MAYREKKIKSGKIFEVEIFPISKKQRKQPRKTKQKLTSKTQRNLNDKNAKKHLARMINTNFTDRDLRIDLTYRDGELPKSLEEAQRDVRNYLRRNRNYRRKHGLPELKYIAVIEYKEQGENKKGVRIHHHIIMNDMDRDTAEEIWGKGRVHTRRLQADEFGYEGLARYISKDPKGNKRWTQSKNLQQPKVDVNDHKFNRRKVMEIAKNPECRELFAKLYPGYILNDCKVVINEINAGTYLYIRLREFKT